MRVEAIRVDNGFLIPLNDWLKNINEDRILVELEINNPIKEDGYAVMDEMIGFYESNRTDASIKHDEIIYELKCD